MTKKISLDDIIGDVDENMIVTDVAYNITCKYIREILLKTPRDIREMTSHLSDGAGKGIRAKLLLLCSANKEGFVPKNAITTAAAIELLHLATLVHDDVIDDSPLRRGIPTVQSKFGKKQAVICGDYILCIASELMAEISSDYEKNESLKKLYPEFLNALQNICLGEHAQNINIGNLDLSLRGYLKIISGKTAALFYVSAYAGALLCEDMPFETYKRDIDYIARFGKYLGIIFQIIDDCKDYELTESEALKPVNYDILNGVITLPLILSMKAKPEIRRFALNSMNENLLSPDLIGKIHESGGVKQSKELSGKYFKKAKGCLNKCKLPKYKNDMLMDILTRANSSAKAF